MYYTIQSTVRKIRGRGGGAASCGRAAVIRPWRSPGVKRYSGSLISRIRWKPVIKMAVTSRGTALQEAARVQHRERLDS